MRDPMDEAHSRDTRLQNQLRELREHLVHFASDDVVPMRIADEALALARRLKKSEDHIVARWN